MLSPSLFFGENKAQKHKALSDLEDSLTYLQRLWNAPVSFRIVPGSLEMPMAPMRARLLLEERGPV